MEFRHVSRVVYVYGVNGKVTEDGKKKKVALPILELYVHRNT